MRRSFVADANWNVPLEPACAVQIKCPSVLHIPSRHDYRHRNYCSYFLTDAADGRVLQTIVAQSFARMTIWRPKWCRFRVIPPVIQRFVRGHLARYVWINLKVVWAVAGVTCPRILVRWILIFPLRLLQDFFSMFFVLVRWLRTNT